MCKNNENNRVLEFSSNANSWMYIRYWFFSMAGMESLANNTLTRSENLKYFKLERMIKCLKLKVKSQ